MAAPNDAGPFSLARRALRRLLHRPPSDWAGPDAAKVAVSRAVPIEVDNFHEVVVLPAVGPDSPGEEFEEPLRRLAEIGHRVFRLSPPEPTTGAGYELREKAPRLCEVSLRGPDFDSLDALRRDEALGATVCLVQDPARRALAERFCAERGWPTVEELSPSVPDFSERLAQAFPRLSVVVVTYNNRDLNRLCLESLFARTEWPNWELLVVDNASSDGTREVLSEFAQRNANLRVIALDENRGFPAACNIGLAEAGGAFLVLLNNDTVVTRGWATSLLRHLTANPKLGLVGPVTNAIANEARVEVGYRDLAALPAWAAAWTRAHDGETFPISMLAFFCVAIRRDVFEIVGTLDEQFGLGLFEDGDYNRRVRAHGWDVLCARDAFVHHWQNASFRQLGKEGYHELFEENRRKFREKWGAES